MEALATPHPPTGLAADDPLFRALAETGDGAAVISADRRVVQWNPAAERLLGYAAADIVGRPCCEVLAEGREGGLRRECALCRLGAPGRPLESLDVEIPTRAGRPARVNVSTLRLRVAPAPLVIHLFRLAAGRPSHPAPVAAFRPVTDGRAAPAGSDTGRAHALTRREREVLQLLITGASTRVAAARLGVSESTIRNHVQNLLGKLGVHSRLEAVAYAAAHRLL